MSTVENNHCPPHLDRLINPQPRRFKAGRYIYTPADEAKTFYLLTAGQVELSRQYPDGQMKTLNILTAGPDSSAFLGGEAFSRLPFYKDTAQVTTNASCLPFSHTLRETFILYRPQDTLLALESAFEQSTQRGDLLYSLAFEPVRDRLPRLLIQHAQPTDQPDQFEVIGFTQQQLANMIGTTRETVNRMIRQLEEAGLIQYVNTKHRKIIIPDMPRFAAEVFRK